jgi:hypothetical protein
MPTQEEQLGFISDAVLLETQAVIALKRKFNSFG